MKWKKLILQSSLTKTELTKHTTTLQNNKNTYIQKEKLWEIFRKIPKFKMNVESSRIVMNVIMKR